MNAKTFISLGLFFLCLISTPATRAQVVSVKVGYIIRDYVDTGRINWLGTGPRPLKSVIWYPAGIGGKREIIKDQVQFSSQVIAYRSAKLAHGKKYPLVLISHGAQGNAQQMRWMAYYFAAKGYIAAVVNHNGTKEEERQIDKLTLSDFCSWERPKDLSVVLNNILKDPDLSNHIDTSRIFAAGFSLGGTTVIWLAGARLNLHDLESKSPPIPAVFLNDVNERRYLAAHDSIVKASFKRAEQIYKDNRIKAVFALAPAIGQGFPKEGLGNINIPVQIVVGDADVVNPMAYNARQYADNIPTARKLIVLPGERGHYTRPPVGDERPKELLQVSQIAYEFFSGIR